MVRAVGGGSPETPPERFAGALGQLSGSSQAGMLRQLQRSYGNSYVGKVIQQQGKNGPPTLTTGTADSSTRLSQSPRPAETAPTEITTPVDLKGQTDFKPPDSVAAFLENSPNKTNKIPIRFGNLATGEMKIQKRNSKNEVKYRTISPEKHLLDLSHPFFNGFAVQDLIPKLSLNIIDSKITGNISLEKGGDLLKRLKDAPELLGLAGFDLRSLSKPINEVKDGGILNFGVKDVEVTLGGVFSGRLTILAEDEAVRFDSTMTLAAQTVKATGGGTLALARSPEGFITGSIDLDVELANFTGKLKGQWDGQTFTAHGSINYQGEKLSGNVNFHVMEKEQADQMLQERKTPPEVTTAKPSPTAKPTTVPPKKGKPNYVVAGEGVLDYTFIDWLHGSAQVIADHKGYVTVIGEIVPQAQIQLFKPPPFRKDFPEFKARATYGLPVIADIFIEAGIGLTLWATIEGNLKDIKVPVGYSTDPTKRNKFSLEGTINISAAAGITLHAFIDAGMTILRHEIKIGAGLNGTLGIKGYAEGKTIVGYREESAEGEDKKGVFFIQGGVEIAAQPFLELSGELHIKLDSPWWSPAPDKTWTWPLGDKEWPLGGGFGIGADVNYVLGSGLAPTVSFKDPEFSGDKFLGDITDDRLDSKKGGETEKKSPWKEKNTPQAKPPTAQAAPAAGVQSGIPTKAPVKAPAIPSSSKKKDKPPPEFDLAGKTPEETESRLARREEQKKAATQQGQQQGPKKGAGKAAQEQADKQHEGQKADPTQKWQRGVAVVEQALAYAEKTGIELDELNKILKSIRRQEYGFTNLYAEDGGEQWVVLGSMSAAKKVKSVKKKEDRLRGKRRDLGNFVHTYAEVVSTEGLLTPPLPSTKLVSEHPFLGRHYLYGRTIRSDRLDMNEHVIYEIKPSGLSKEGQQQVNYYVDRANRELGGKPWRGFVVTYVQEDAYDYAVKIGYFKKEEKEEETSPK